MRVDGLVWEKERTIQLQSASVLRKDRAVRVGQLYTLHPKSLCRFNCKLQT